MSGGVFTKGKKTVARQREKVEATKVEQKMEEPKKK